MLHQQLDRETTEKVDAIGQMLLQVLCECIPKDGKYTQPNLLLNCIMCCLARFLIEIPDEIRDKMVKDIAYNLEQNLNHIRELGL